MFITKKQIFLAFFLTIYSLSIVASGGGSEQTPGYFSRVKNWFTGQSQPKPQPVQRETELKEALQGILPSGVLSIIQEYAEEYLPYTPIRTFKSPANLQALGFDDNTKKLTLVSSDGQDKFTVSIYNIQTGDIKKQFVIDRPHERHTVLLSGNGKILMIDKDIFDTGTEAIIYQVPDIRVPSTAFEDYYGPVSFNHDGSILVLTSHPLRNIPAPLIFLNVETKVQVIADFIYWPRNDSFPLFSPDGKTVVSVSRSQGQNIVLLDALTGQRKNIISLPSSSGHMSLVLNNDASLLAYAIHQHNTGIVSNIVDTHTGGIIQSITTSQQGAHSSLFSSRQPIITAVSALVGFSRNNNVYVIANTALSYSLQLWNTETRSLTKVIDLEQRQGRTPTVKLSPDDRFIILNHPDTIEILKRSTQTEIVKEEREKKREQEREIETQRDAQRIEQQRLQSAEQARLREQQQRNQEAIQQEQPEALTPTVEDVD